MATYKVIQDIEADDKLLGPLSLKQFIFAAVALTSGFLGFWLGVKIGWFIAIPFIPPLLVFGILAAPLGRDQPTEVWLAAQIRFFLKPRKRIWDQSGIKELVTITVPKKLEHIYTDGLNQQQVRSRLNALASTVDSRGWAVKNIDLNLAPAYAGDYSDRLVSPSNLPQAVTEINVTAADDILDPTANPVAQHFDEMVKQSGQAQKSAAIARMQAARTTVNQASATPVDYSFINSAGSAIPAGQAVFAADQVVAPAPTTKKPETYLEANQQPSEEEAALLEQIHAHKKQDTGARNPHHKTIKTPEQLAEAERQKEEKLKAQAVTPLPNPVNIELAKSASDLKISTVASMAKNKVSATEGEIRIQH